MTSVSGDQSVSVYETTRQLILSGELQMGERIVETRLAQRLGQSRTPIREALRRLTSDGLVVFMPHRGYEVICYTASDVAEIYSCRVLLESEAVRLVAGRGLTASLEGRLEQLMTEADAAFAADLAPDVLRQQFLRMNNDFHRLLYAHCGNDILLGMIRKVTEIPVGIRNYFLFSDALLAASHAAHKQILRAVQKREPERAAALIREHIWTAKDRMIEPDDADKGAGTPSRRGDTEFEQPAA